MMTSIILNGENYAIAQGKNIVDLVAQLDLTGQAIAVAVNRQIVSRQQWPHYQLQMQDKVDVVRAIGGG